METKGKRHTKFWFRGSLIFIFLFLCCLKIFLILISTKMIILFRTQDKFIFKKSLINNETNFCLVVPLEVKLEINEKTSSEIISNTKLHLYVDWLSMIPKKEVEIKPQDK